MKKIFAILAVAALVAMVGCAKQAAPGSTVDDQQVAGAGQTQGSGGGTTGGSGVQSQGGSAMPAAPAAMERVYFDFDQYTLSADAKATLEGNAAYLMANKSVWVKIEGHCDERGSDEYNLALGEKRALAVMNYLVSLGVSKNRLSVISYGEERPLVAGSSEAAWAQNRRAEFVKN